MNLKHELELAEDAARTSGEYLVTRFQERQEVLSSEGRDLKIEADTDSAGLIAKSLKKHSPYPLLCEEKKWSSAGADNSKIWIVDPLDGTVNYAKGLPMCCVSIGLWKGDDPLLGVIYDFVRDELFWGMEGAGAWCNNSSVKASSVNVPAEAVLATGFPVSTSFESDSLSAFLTEVQTFKKVRLLGSAALSLAYVACGRVDAYIEKDIMLWDVAAGIAIVRAAGCWCDIRRSGRKDEARTVLAAGSDTLFPDSLKHRDGG